MFVLNLDHARFSIYTCMYFRISFQKHRRLGVSSLTWATLSSVALFVLRGWALARPVLHTQKLTSFQSRRDQIHSLPHKNPMEIQGTAATMMVPISRATM